MIKTVYKPDLTNSDILKHKNVLSWKSKTKDGYLPIIQIKSKTLFWLWWKSLFNKLYFLTCTNTDHSDWSYEFFKTVDKK